MRLPKCILVSLPLLLLTGCGASNASFAVADLATPTLSVALPAPTSTPLPPTQTPTSTNTPAPTPSSTPSPAATSTPLPTLTPTQTPVPVPVVRQLTTGNCCTGHYWYGNNRIRFIDKDPQTDEVGIWGIDIQAAEPERVFITEKLGYTSPDGRYLAYPDRSTGLAVIEDTETGEKWSLDLDESSANFTPDSTRILWTESDPDLPFERRTSTYWIANVDGSERRRIASINRASTLAWLDDQTLLISTFINDGTTSPLSIQTAIVGTLSLVDGQVTDLFTVPRPRGVSLNPSKTGMVYFVALASDPAENGVWYLDLTGPPYSPRKLPFVGSYQWQNDTTLIYIPFDIEAEAHQFYSYDISTGQTADLTVALESFIVANNDWTISPDGKNISWLAAKGNGLDGIWLMTLP